MGKAKQGAKTGTKRDVGYKRPPKEHQFKPGNTAAAGKGRPKTLSQLRALIQSLANEPSDGRPEWTRLQLMLRGMLASRSPADRKEILRYGYGEPPTETTNLNVDWSQLTDEQLERIAKGEDVRRVISTGPGARSAGTAPPPPDSHDADDG